MCCALFEKAIQTTWWRKKWPCKILHIAGLLNSENPIQIQTETFIKHVLLAKVRAINCLKNTNHRTRKRQEWGGGGLIMKKFLFVNEIKKATSIIRRSLNTTLPKRRHRESKIPISTLDSIFLTSFHITALINYVRLNCRIRFYLKTNDAFIFPTKNDWSLITLICKEMSRDFWLTRGTCMHDDR